MFEGRGASGVLVSSLQIGFCQIAQFAALASLVSTWTVYAHLGQLLYEGADFLKKQAEKKMIFFLYIE